MKNNTFILIIGDRGTGKTLLTSIIAALDEKRGVNYYMNYEINKKNAIYVNNLNTMFEMMAKDKNRKVIVIDEAQKLMNSRKSMTDLNMKMVKFIVESRKFGADVIMVAQTYMGVDKQVREQADWVIELERDGRGKGVSAIAVIKKKIRDRRTGELFFYAVNIMFIEDMVMLMKKLNVEYDTTKQVDLFAEKE